VEQAQDAQTAGDLSRLVGSSVHRREEPARPPERPPEGGREGDLVVPGPLRAIGRAVLGVAQRALYEDLYRARVDGRVHVPAGRNVLVVANHASHLDMGLVKIALGEQGERFAALAAADYFFDTPVKRAFFGNFTNLIPMDRRGSVRKSLRAAATALSRGYNVLIFPEGTRSRDGTMAPFKPTAGYLALHCGVDVLPVYLHGTHEALAKGSLVPRRTDLRVAIGAPIPVAELRRLTADLPKGRAHEAATRLMEQAVRGLRDRVLADVAAGTGAGGTGHGAAGRAPAGEAADVATGDGTAHRGGAAGAAEPARHGAAKGAAEPGGAAPAMGAEDPP
jgi:long-chain acyl-CoA synthetase